MVMIYQSVYTDRHEIHLCTCIYSCPEILVSGVVLLHPIGNVCYYMCGVLELSVYHLIVT